MSTHRNSRLVGGVTALAATALRIALALAGFVLALGALLVGLVLSAALVVWALSRGRQPLAHVFGGRRHGMRGGFAGGAFAPVGASRGEIVDTVVREVPSSLMPAGRTAHPRRLRLPRRGTAARWLRGSLCSPPSARR